jgi:hypothetical protein
MGDETNCFKAWSSGVDCRALRGGTLPAVDGFELGFVRCIIFRSFLLKEVLACVGDDVVSAIRGREVASCQFWAPSAIIFTEILSGSRNDRTCTSEQTSGNWRSRFANVDKNRAVMDFSS